MKYVKKIPAKDNQISMQLLSDGWKKIKEPGNLVLALLLSFPFAFALGGVTAWLAYLLKPELFSFILSEPFCISVTIDIKLFLFLSMVFVYTFIHEMIHAVFIPGFTKSDQTYWGLNGFIWIRFYHGNYKKTEIYHYNCHAVFPFVGSSAGCILSDWFT